MVVLLCSVMEVHAGCYGNKMRWWMLPGKVSENSVHRFLDSSCRVSSDEAGAWGGAVVRASLVESVTDFKHVCTFTEEAYRLPALSYNRLQLKSSKFCLFFLFFTFCEFMYIHGCTCAMHWPTLSYPEHPSESSQEDDEKEQRSELQEDG